VPLEEAPVTIHQIIRLSIHGEPQQRECSKMPIEVPNLIDYLVKKVIFIKGSIKYLRYRLPVIIETIIADFKDATL
jgi:hypothetical protein